MVTYGVEVGASETSADTSLLSNPHNFCMSRLSASKLVEYIPILWLTLNHLPAKLVQFRNDRKRHGSLLPLLMPQRNPVKIKLGL